MKTDIWRQGAAAILAAGLLTIAAVAQTGEASGEVKIEGEKPPAAAAAGTKPTAKPVKPTITDRDPFVNQVNAGTVSPDAVGRVRRTTSEGPAVRPPANRAASNGPSKGPGGKGTAAAEEEVPEVIVPAPEVTITGIVRSGSGRVAIVNSGTSSYMVVPGQKLGDYRVSTITDTAVTFTHTGKAFKVPIDSFRK
jgi:hypothetical protein